MSSFEIESEIETFSYYNNSCPIQISSDNWMSSNKKKNSSSHFTPFTSCLRSKKPKQSLSPIDSPLKFEQKSNTVLNNPNVYDNLCNYSISDISYLDLDSSTD